MSNFLILQECNGETDFIGRTMLPAEKFDRDAAFHYREDAIDECKKRRAWAKREGEPFSFFVYDIDAQDIVY